MKYLKRQIWYTCKCFGLGINGSWIESRMLDELDALGLNCKKSIKASYFIKLASFRFAVHRLISALKFKALES